VFYESHLFEMVSGTADGLLGNRVLDLALNFSGGKLILACLVGFVDEQDHQPSSLVGLVVLLVFSCEVAVWNFESARRAV
jgi:hypothetical protein